MNRKQRRQNKKSKPSTSALTMQAARDPKLDAMFKRGKDMMDKGDLVKATEIFQSIMQQKPDHIEAVEQMAICAMKLGQHDTALNFFNALKQARPQETIKWDAYIGCTYRNMDRYDEAIPLLEKAYKHIPTTEIKGALATCYILIGDFERGKQHIEDLLEQDPNNIQYLHVYAERVMKFDSHDHPLLLRLLKFEKKSQTLSNEERASLFYTLHKAYEDLDEPETAFSYAIKGAKEMRNIVHYDMTKRKAINSKILNYYSKKACHNFDKEEGFPSEKPVFILAMPRSGTTLLEQILNAHRDIAGIGEDIYLHRLITRYAAPPYGNENNFLFGWIRENGKLLSPYELGQKYDEYITKKRSKARFVVNKAMGIYEQVGYIKAALPNASFIYIKRNAADACTSMFTKLFENKSQEYSYDFKELADRYHMHINFMQHWNDIYGDDILHVNYEDLVNDQERETRRILEYIGAEWDSACLEHHKQKSVVKTASVQQVRKPVYTSSINRWKRYGSKVAPLIEALGDAAPQGAKDWLKEVQQ